MKCDSVLVVAYSNDCRRCSAPCSQAPTMHIKLSRLVPGGLRIPSDRQKLDLV